MLFFTCRVVNCEAKRGLPENKLLSTTATCCLSGQQRHEPPALGADPEPEPVPGPRRAGGAGGAAHGRHAGAPSARAAPAAPCGGKRGSRGTGGAEARPSPGGAVNRGRAGPKRPAVTAVRDSPCRHSCCAPRKGAR